MQDETIKGEETPVISSNDETIEGLETVETETKPVVETKTEEEPRIPLSRLKEETSKRRELESRLADMEMRLNSVTSARTSDENSDPDIEAAIEKLTPLLQKKGFTTRQQIEDENSAKAYAEEMKKLAKDIDGSDGRPAFDAYEVTEWGKAHRVYDLQSAYELMNKKALLDWEMKQVKSSPSIQTEKPSNSGNRSSANPILTREAISKRMSEPGGYEWYEKNREKLLSAAARGEIS